MQALARTVEVPLAAPPSSAAAASWAAPPAHHLGRRLSSCCYGEAHGVVVASAWYSRLGHLRVSARRTGSGSGGPEAVSTALGDEEEVLATQLIAGGALLALAVARSPRGLQDRNGDGPRGGAGQIELVVVDLWCADDGGGPRAHRRGLPSLAGLHASAALRIVGVDAAPRSTARGGGADRWAGDRFILLAGGAPAALHVCDASWVIRGDGMLGAPYELHGAQTLQSSLTSMVSWPLQWLEASSGAAKAREGGPADVAPAGSSFPRDGARGGGVVVYASAKFGAAMRRWQVHADTEPAAAGDLLSSEIPLFRPAGGADIAGAAAAVGDAFDADVDAVELLHVSDGGRFVAAAVGRRAGGGDAARTPRYRLLSWRVTGRDASESPGVEHLSTRTLQEAEAPAQLAVADDGTVTWLAGGGDPARGAAVHAFGSAPGAAGGERVLTVDMGMRMELPVGSIDGGAAAAAADINRAAFVADWIQRRIADEVDEADAGGAAAPNRVAKWVMADALARRMMSDRAGWCRASAARALQIEDGRLDLIPSRESLAGLLLEYAEQEVGAAGRNSTAAVLAVLARVCGAYYALALQSRPAALLFSVRCPRRAAAAGAPPACVTGILRGADGIGVFTALGRLSGLGAHEAYRLSGLGLAAAAPTGSMTRLAVDAAQARGVSVLDDLMPLLAAGALGERVLSAHEPDWIDHASEVRNTLAAFFDALNAPRGGGGGALVGSVRDFVHELEAAAASADGAADGAAAGAPSRHATAAVSFVGSCVVSAVAEVSLGLALLISVIGKLPDALGLNMQSVLEMRSDTRARVMHLLTSASALKALCGGAARAAAAPPSAMDDAGRLSTLTLQGPALRRLRRPEDTVTVLQELLAGGKIAAPPADLAGPAEVALVCAHAARAASRAFGALFPGRQRTHSFVDHAPSVVDLGLILFMNGYFDELEDVIALCAGLPRCGCRYAMLLLRGLSAIARRRRAEERAAAVGREPPGPERERLERRACSLLIEAGAGIAHEPKLDELFRMLVPELTGLGEREAMETLGPLGRAQYYEVVMIMFERYGCLRAACELGTAALREVAPAPGAGGCAQHSRVSHNLFKYLCDLREFTGAYNVLRHIPPDGGHSTCLQRLTVLMIEAGAVQDLVDIPYGALTREVELSLQDRALMSPISVATQMYGTLFVFHVSRSQHLSAAKCMAECACRVGTETGLERRPGKQARAGAAESLALLASMKHALLAAINALRLVEDPGASVNVAFDGTNDFDYASFRSGPAARAAGSFSREPPRSSALDLVAELVPGSAALESIKSLAGPRAGGASDFSRRVKVLTGTALRVRLAVTCARIELLAWGSARGAQERHLSAASVHELVAALVDARLHAAALQLGLQLAREDGERFGSGAIEMALCGLARHCCEVNVGRQAPRADMAGGADVDMAPSPTGDARSPLADLERDMRQLSELPSAAALDAALGGVGLEAASLSSWDRLRVAVQHVLARHREAGLWSAVAATVLGYDGRMRLPVWLVDLGAGIDWVDVVKVLMKFDLVYEAAEQVIEAIAAWRGEVRTPRWAHRPVRARPTHRSLDGTARSQCRAPVCAPLRRTLPFRSARTRDPAPPSFRRRSSRSCERGSGGSPRRVPRRTTSTWRAASRSATSWTTSSARTATRSTSTWNSTPASSYGR